MTKLEKDYNRALGRLFVYEENAAKFIPAREVETEGGYVTDYYEMFYTCEGGEYVEDLTAYYDLIEMQEELDAEFEGDYEEEEF